jgi:hypothetical protein
MFNEVPEMKKHASRVALSRRSLLGAAAGLAGAAVARAQVSGLVPDGGTPPFRLPMGALNFLDRKQYSHNMEIHAHIPGSTISGGEPLMALWAKGRQRLLPANGGFVDVSDAKNPAVMNKGVVRGGGAVVYNTKLKKWIMMCTAAAPLTSATPQFPHGQYDKELRERSTGFKGLRGIRNYDITNPAKPELLQEFNTGEKATARTTTSTTAAGMHTWIAAGTTNCAWRTINGRTATPS